MESNNVYAKIAYEAGIGFYYSFGLCIAGALIAITGGVIALIAGNCNTFQGSLVTQGFENNGMDIYSNVYTIDQNLSEKK